MLSAGERGSALLLVVGATAALGALALTILSVSLLSYEIAVLEHHGAQARLLSRAGVDLAAREVVAGRVAPPPPGLETTWTPALPPPPPGAPPLPQGCRVTVRLTRVDTATTPPVLFDALAEARCGRGFDRRTARFERAADGTVRRLY